jgi:hypothetical protein
LYLIFIVFELLHYLLTILEGTHSSPKSVKYRV